MSALLNKAGKNLFAKHLEQYAPADPLYETYTDERGRTKRRKRELPPGLSKRDAKILRSVKRRAHYLDKGFNLCGLRFGWTFFIGLIPLVGDVADAAINYLLVVRVARRADIPPWLLQRMLLNNAVSAAVGFIPVAGDIVLAMYKANSRNAALLEEFLRIRGEEFLKMSGEHAEHPHDRKKKNGGMGGWFGGKKQSQAAGGTSDQPLPPSDVEQVKPGAGMSGAEVKQAMPVNPTHVMVQKNGKSSPPQMGTTSLAPLMGTTKKASPPPPSSGFNFFGRKKSNSESSIGSPANTGKGRFVENVDSQPV